MNTRGLLRALSCYYPKRLRDPRDYGGLMAGKLKPETSKILLCLDYDDEVFAQAVSERPDLIISHHPFIYGTPMKVLRSDPIKKNLWTRTIASGLAVYSIHTNFDAGTPGMNDALAAQLDLRNIRHLAGSSMARGGDLPEEMDVREFASFAKKRLGADYGFLIACGKSIIKSVAIIGGGGWMENELAQKEGYDIFISGDIPHHGRREVVLRHYDYLDLPHEIERIFMPAIQKTLLKIDPTLKIVIVDHEKLPEIV